MPLLHRLGWILFLVCAVLYSWAGIRDGDPLIVIGSVTFGVACVFFLVPSRTPRRQGSGTSRSTAGA